MNYNNDYKPPNGIGRTVHYQKWIESPGRYYKCLRYSTLQRLNEDSSPRLLNMSKSSNIEPIELDGRTLEGGGQLIRNALCLAALTGVPIKITDIRGNRSGGGGLKAQHLAGVKWLAHACNARVEGDEKGSKTLLFVPGAVNPGGLSPAFTKRKQRDGREVFECRLSIGTAGSTGLALQAILPYILFTKFPAPLPVRLTVSGGTNVTNSPSYDYVTTVLLPTLHSIGFPQITATLDRRGWSHGGTSIGEFTLEIPPRGQTHLPAFQYGPSEAWSSAPEQQREEQAPAPQLPANIHATLIAPDHCHSHLRTVLAPAIQKYFGPKFTISSSNITDNAFAGAASDDGESAGPLTVTCEDSRHEKRLYLLLVATIPGDAQRSKTYRLAADHLWQSKLRSHSRAIEEMVARVSATLAQEWRSGAWVDEYLRDQLVIFQALAQENSFVWPGCEVEGEESGNNVREPSLHARTAEWVAKQLLRPRVRFEENGSCEGVGFGVEGG